MITPATATVAVGGSITLSAEALDAAGNTVPGHSVVWASSDRDVATVSNGGVVTGVSVGSVQIAASIEGRNAVAEVTVNPTPVASVRLSPTSRSLFVGETVQLSAEPLDVGGAVLEGRPVTFRSSNETVASVSTSGLVTALASGSAIITASSEGRSAVATITVSLVPVASVVVSPSSSALVVGQTTELIAEARDGTGQPLAGRAIAWSSSAPSVASVSSAGVVTALSAGEATITAVSEGKSGTATVAVSPKPVSAVIVSPGQVTVVAGKSAQLAAQVTDAQGNVLTGRPVAFSTSNGTIATVSQSGLVTGVAPGAAIITATSEGKSGTASVTVTPVPVASVTIAPAEPNVTVGETVQLQATAKDAGGQTLSGRKVSWSSGAPSIASVSASGVVTGLATGTAIVFANIDGVVGSATVTVRQVQVASVEVTPATASIAVGGTVQLSARVLDASGAELTGRLVGWTSSDNAVAVVSSTGRVTALAVGTATITASSEGQSGSATVTVTDVPVASVTVSPSTLALTVGETGSLSATVRDASNAVLTGRTVTWSSGAPGVATVSPNGTVTAVAEGTATITATSEGKSGSATVTVSPAGPVPVASVDVSPSTVNLEVGKSQQVTATPRDADGGALSGRVVTWASGNTGVATVTQDGLITAVGVGNTTVTATSEGKVGTVTVSVSAPTVGTVAVSPGSATVNVAFTTTLQATVRDESGVTISGADVAWSTSNPLVAVVSQSGVVTGLLPGTATITATSSGKSGTATITVVLAPVASVTVSPSSLDLRESGDRRRGQLTATVRDALGNVLTGRVVTWTSSNTSVATVDGNGLVTAQKRGSATITATSEAKTGTASVTVRKN